MESNKNLILCFRGLKQSKPCKVDRKEKKRKIEQRENETFVILYKNKILKAQSLINLLSS